MQSMQRQFGKLLSKGPGDNAKVSVILNDYEDADKVLARVCIPPALQPLTMETVECLHDATLVWSSSANLCRLTGKI